MPEIPKQIVIGQDNLQAGRDINVYPPPEPQNHQTPALKRISWWSIGVLVFTITIAVLAIIPHASIGVPFVNQEVAGSESWNVYYLEVPIRNKSYFTTIRVMDFQLTELQRLEGSDFKPWGNITSASLEWGNRREIPPRHRVTIPFARIFPPELQKMMNDSILSGNPDIPQVRFTVARWHRKMTSHVEPGIYRFKLIVSFEKAPPAEAEVELVWPGNQRGSTGAIAQEIRIKKL